MYFKHIKCVLTSTGKIRSSEPIDKSTLASIIRDVKKNRASRPIHFMVAEHRNNPGIFAKLLFVKRENLYDVIFCLKHVILVEKVLSP